MKFATGAEKAAYYREKKKNEVKASKLKYYNENADKINRKRSRPLEPSVISNAAIRQQKSRKNKAVKREKNRLYQVTFRKKNVKAHLESIHSKIEWKNVGS